MRWFYVFLISLLSASNSFGGEKVDSIYFNGHYYSVVIFDFAEVLSSKVLSKGSVSEMAFPSTVKAYLSVGLFSVDQNCLPLGLLQCDNQLINTINLSDGAGNFFLKPNAVFSASNKEVAITESSNYKKSKKNILSFQSGPMLLNKGLTHPKINYYSKNTLYRSATGVSNIAGLKKVIFVKSLDKVSLYDTAQFLQLYYSCSDAILLESGVVNFDVFKGSDIRGSALSACWSLLIPINTP